jgi:hypothetical protein
MEHLRKSPIHQKGAVEVLRVRENVRAHPLLLTLNALCAQ